jgi:hypothetical protein
MSSAHLIELIYAVLTVIITIVLIIGLKIYGNLPIENIGPELNILTYGFMWDTILSAHVNI